MKKLLVLVFAIALCLGVLCVGASADIQPTEPTDGDGTAEKPYQIGTAAELYWFAGLVNSGKTNINAVLTDDITINENGTLNGTPTYTWTPIGDYINAYTGTFDGQNHTISGLYYNGSGDYAGLFGRVDSGGRVQNVNVVDSYISNSFSYGCAGGVCGWNIGTITNCSFDGTVTGSVTGTYVGGVCGYNSGMITNCSNTGSVTGTGTGTGYTGGLCGGNDGTITNCYNTGTITDTGNVGAVCGKNSGTITNCYWHEDTVLTGYGINTGKVTSVEDKTTGEFASGEVAWLLNQGQENGPWRQNIVTDTSPVLNSKHGSVIKVTVLDETSTDYYGNGNHVTLPNPSPNEAYFNSSGEYIDPASYSFTDGETVYLKTAVKITVVYGNDTEDEIKYVASGDTFKLPAAPSKSGYTFVGWSDGSKTYEAGESVTVTGDMTFTAMWQAINIPDPNGITVTQPSNGTVKVNPSNGSAGTLITVTATPDEGYELAYITVDGERISGTSFTMPEHDVTVRVYFTNGGFPFTDVAPGAWYYDAVSYVYANGLMDGVSASEFNPDGSMTRAMVWAILARIDGETVTGASWLETARAWAMAEGVSDGTDANGLVTREQLATMLWRYAGEPDSDYSLSAFTDAASVSEWAETAMSWAVENGLITGVTANTLVPSGSATRAQCAAILMRYVENI